MNETMENGVVEVVEGVVEETKNSGISWKSAGIGAGILAGGIALVRYAVIPGVKKIASKIASCSKLSKSEDIDDEILDEDEIEMIESEK